MPYEVSYWETKKIISIKNIGQLNYYDFIKQCEETLDLVFRLKTGAILVQSTKMELHLTTLEVFSFPSLYEKKGVPRTNKLAALIPENSAALNDNKFYENVCQNRGWQVNVFTNKDSALKWLDPKRKTCDIGEINLWPDSAVRY